ncbi:hypothetical protein ABZT43_12380 [Streptomyces sp. NPDC005349]|uniref:hypothetical protein n=1 Tax=Streptomyces sp. NPDC005349 TaxID=3157037 RepID=UPI0033A67809
MSAIRPVEVVDDPQVAAVAEALRARCLDSDGRVIDSPHVIATVIVEAQRATRKARKDARNKWIDAQGRRILDRCYAGHVPARIVTSALIDKARRDQRLHLLKEES